MNTPPDEPSRRRWLRASLGLGAAAASLAHGATGESALRWRERTLLGFGTTLSLRAAHTDARRLDAGLDAAIAEIRIIESQMSLFDADSALCRLNAVGELQAADPRLIEVLQLAQRVAQRSDGAFDVTMQPLWLAWSQAKAQRRLPTMAELAQARARVDWRRLELHENRVRLGAPGMALSLNGIAQGYAADRARKVLQDHGVAHALLDTGEWAPLGHADDATGPWRLGIADPHRHGALVGSLATDGRCVATSGDDRTVFSADRRHHHIVDPREGHSPALLSSVTVLADSGALADALTKVFFMAETRLTPTQRRAAAGRARPARPDAGLARAAAAPRFDAALARVAQAIAAEWKVDALLVDKRGATWTSPGLRIDSV